MQERRTGLKRLGLTDRSNVERNVVEGSLTPQEMSNVAGYALSPRLTPISARHGRGEVLTQETFPEQSDLAGIVSRGVFGRARNGWDRAHSRGCAVGLAVRVLGGPGGVGLLLAFHYAVIQAVER